MVRSKLLGYLDSLHFGSVMIQSSSNHFNCKEDNKKDYYEFNSAHILTGINCIYLKIVN